MSSLPGSRDSDGRGPARCRASRRPGVGSRAHLAAGLIALLVGVSSCAPGSKQARILLLGDVMLGRGVTRAHASTRWNEALAALGPMTGAVDLAGANLESPLTNAALLEPAGFDLRAPPDAAWALAAAGLSFVTLANNHAGDAGERGIQQTRAALESQGIRAAGPGAQPLLFDVGGLRVAFVALDDVTRPLDEAGAEATISRAYQEHGLVIVSIHWGSEYAASPNARQLRLAEALAGAGAGVIWGHHPHVVQPLEWVEGGRLPHATLVAYSLGNALFDQAGSPDTRRSVALGLTLGEDGVRAIEAFALVIDPQSVSLHEADDVARHALQTRLGPLAGEIH